MPNGEMCFNNYTSSADFKSMCSNLGGTYDENNFTCNNNSLNIGCGLYIPKSGDIYSACENTSSTRYVISLYESGYGKYGNLESGF